MKLKHQLTLATSLAVAIAIAVASVIVYFVVRGQLRGQIDRALETEQTSVTIAPRPEEVHLEAPGEGNVFLRVPSPQAGDVVPFVQLISDAGDVVAPDPADAFTPTDEALAVAASGEGVHFEDMDVDGIHIRVMTRSTEEGTAIQVGRSLEEVDDTLRGLAFFLSILSLVGIGFAAFLGRLVARTTLTPLARLTDAAEHVAETSDLSRRIEVTGEDEIGRLATTFNEMLSALEGSLRAQKQLVADASHELRTPLTSIRTNIELLARKDVTDPLDRERILAAAIAELEGLTAIVGDVVELARGNELPLERDDVRLDHIAAQVVERARARTPDVDIQIDVEPWTVMGDRSRLERALSNLVDNALKWTPPGSSVALSLRDGEVMVRDSGPGVDEVDMSRIFDRFYRAPNARSLPGSGLGLAIVRQVVTDHDGEVSVENAPEGGAVFRVRFPDARPVDVLS